MITKKTISILEKHDIRIFDREKQGLEYYRELEFYSNAGEDVIETMWYNGTNKGFISAFTENANNFDPDEHTEMWIDVRGKNGAPETIRELLNDADEIKNFLLSVANELTEGKQ